MKAKLTLILETKDPKAMEDLAEMKRDIDSGTFQRDTLRQSGVKCKATFEFL